MSYTLDAGKKIAAFIANVINVSKDKKDIERIDKQIIATQKQIEKLQAQKAAILPQQVKVRKKSDKKTSEKVVIKVVNVSAEVKHDDLKATIELLQAKQCNAEVMQVAQALFMNVAANININDLCRNMRKRLQRNDVKQELFAHLAVHYVIKHNLKSFDDMITLRSNEQMTCRDYVNIHRINQVLRNKANLLSA